MDMTTFTDFETNCFLLFFIILLIIKLVETYALSSYYIDAGKMMDGAHFVICHKYWRSKWNWHTWRSSGDASPPVTHNWLYYQLHNTFAQCSFYSNSDLSASLKHVAHYEYHGLCGSNKLFYKRWALSMAEGQFWLIGSKIYWPIVLKFKVNKHIWEASQHAKCG